MFWAFVVKSETGFARGKLIAALTKAGIEVYLAEGTDDVDRVVAEATALMRREIAESAHFEGGVIRAQGAILDLARMEYVSSEISYGDFAPTEFRLLAYLMMNAGRVIGRDELLNHVWREPSIRDPSNAIDVYIRRLRNRMEADPANPMMIHTVRGEGYVFKRLVDRKR